MENKEKYCYNLTPEQLEKTIREVIKDVTPEENERQLKIFTYKESVLEEFDKAMKEEAKKYKCTIENPLTDGERRRGDFPTDYFRKNYIMGIDPYEKE